MTSSLKIFMGNLKKKLNHIASIYFAFVCLFLFFIKFVVGFAHKKKSQFDPLTAFNLLWNWNFDLFSQKSTATGYFSLEKFYTLFYSMQLLCTTNIQKAQISHILCMHAIYSAIFFYVLFWNCCCSKNQFDRLTAFTT